MADLTRATVGIVDESTVQESAAPVQDIELTEDETCLLYTSRPCLHPYDCAGGKSGSKEVR